MAVRPCSALGAVASEPRPGHVRCTLLLGALLAAVVLASAAPREAIAALWIRAAGGAIVAPWTWAAPGGAPPTPLAPPAPALLRTLDGHDSGVAAIAFSSDGTRLASTGLDGLVQVWDAATGRRTDVLRGDRARAGDLMPLVVAVSRSGGLVAVGDADGLVSVWDTVSGRRLPGPPTRPQPVSALAFAPGDRLVAAAHEDGAIELWDPRRSRGARQLASEEVAISALAFSPDGRTLASGGAGARVTLWEVATGRVARTMIEEPPVPVLAFAPDGRALATAGERSVTLWNTTTGAPLLIWPTPRVRALAFSPDGAALMAAGIDGEVRRLDARTGAVLGVVHLPDRLARIAVEPRRGLVATVAIVPDSADPTTHLSTEVRLWDARPERPTPALAPASAARRAAA
jgi:WD40 repeat protein